MMRRFNVTLVLLALALIAAWALGGGRALLWAELALAGAIIGTGFTWIRRDRRRGEAASWSTVYLGSGVACLALASETRPLLGIPLLLAGVVFIVVAVRGFNRDNRQAQALLDEAQRALDLRGSDKSP
jgi:hypothetical protein